MPRKWFANAGIAKDLRRLAVGQSAYSSTIVNWGFELGINGNWANNDLNASMTVTIDTTTFHSGKQSLKVVNTAAGEDDFVYSATIPTTPGATYQVSAWVNCPTFTAVANSSRGLAVWPSPGSVVQQTLTAATSGWVKQSVVVVTPAAFLQIRLYSPQGTVYWDDVSIECTDPGTYSAHPAQAANTWAGTSNLHLNSAVATNAGDLAQTKTAAINTLANTTNLHAAQAISTINSPGKELVVDTFARTAANLGWELGNQTGWGVNGLGTVTLTVDTVTTPFEGTRSGQVVCDGTSATQGLTYTINPNITPIAGDAWTVSAYVKGPAGATVNLQVIERDASQTALTSSQSPNFTLTGGWDRVLHTRTLNQATVKYLGAKVFTSSAQAITFNVDALQFDFGVSAQTYGQMAVGRADSTQLWGGSGVWAISNNVLTNISGINGDWLAINSQSQNVEVSAQLTSPLPTSTGIYAHSIGNSPGINCYLLNTSSGGGGNLYRVLNGSFVSLSSISAATYVAGDSMGLRVIGNQISYLKNGAVLLTVTDTNTPFSGTWVGARSGATAVEKWGNFRVVAL